LNLKRDIVVSKFVCAFKFNLYRYAQGQLRELAMGVDVLVATPGRLTVGAVLYKFNPVVYP
jgi:superfamily II DNA/RNA helicase